VAIVNAWRRVLRGGLGVGSVQQWGAVAVGGGDTVALLLPAWCTPVRHKRRAGSWHVSSTAHCPQPLTSIQQLRAGASTRQRRSRNDRPVFLPEAPPLHQRDACRGVATAACPGAGPCAPRRVGLERCAEAGRGADQVQPVQRAHQHQKHCSAGCAPARCVGRERAGGCTPARAASAASERRQDVDPSAAVRPATTSCHYHFPRIFYAVRAHGAQLAAIQAAKSEQAELLCSRCNLNTNIIVI
jgi:hypothetical protein